MTDFGDAIFLAIFLGLPGVLAAGGVTLLARKTLPAVAGGLALLVPAALLPLAFGYAIVLGVAAAVLGGTAAALWQGRRLGLLHRTYLALAVLSMIVVPAGLINASEIQAHESFDRCAADKAVAIVEQSQATGQGYPADLHAIAMDDGNYGDRPCYLSNGVNWLYKVGGQGTYTLGYWVDWRVTRRVCLHAARTQGWSCGFEMWGPFRPGEVD
jgi:hypothetical protein